MEITVEKKLMEEVESMRCREDKEKWEEEEEDDDEEQDEDEL